MAQKFEIAWQAPEFEYYEKDISWYWLSVIIAVVVLSAAVWQKNFLFAAFIIFAEILILVWAGQKPKTVEFKLDERGLTIGNRKFYPYAEMTGFSADENNEDEWRDFIFRFQRRLQPTLKVKTPKNRFGEIEKALAPIVKKIEFEESFLETLERFLGF
ncbi:MAG: hypothetical protein HY433_01700 [Candidatus Liptonbacteria bacterium]|nr:hypothetical protein [Candidatus Liptonbacteria bacterium]